MANTKGTKDNKESKGNKGSKSNKKESKNTEVGTKLLFALTGGLLKGSTAYVSYTTDLTPEGVHTKFKDYYGPDVVVNFVESSSTKKHYDALGKEMDADSLVYSGKGTNPFSLYSAVSAKKVLGVLSSVSGVESVSKFTSQKEKKKPASKKGAKKGAKDEDENVNADEGADSDEAEGGADAGAGKPNSPVSKKKPAGKKAVEKKDESDSGSDNESGSGSGSDSESENGSASDSDSESEDKKPTKKTSDKKK